MNKPITVKHALRLIEMALKAEAKATEGPWEPNPVMLVSGVGVVARFPSPRTDGCFAMMDNAAFVSLSRATVRPMLEYLKGKLETGFSLDIQIVKSGTFSAEIMALYPVIAALNDHYSADLSA